MKAGEKRSLYKISPGSEQKQKVKRNERGKRLAFSAAFVYNKEEVSG